MHEPLSPPHAFNPMLTKVKGYQHAKNVPTITASDLAAFTFFRKVGGAVEVYITFRSPPLTLVLPLESAPCFVKGEPTVDDGRRLSGKGVQVYISDAL